MSERIDSLPPIMDLPEGQLNAGWGKKNIVPDEPMRMAGIGIRKPYEQVHDSTFARALVINNGFEKVAIISLDLLIFPPIVADKVINELKQKGYSSQNLYFSATHTHNAAGGWIKGPAGRIIAGKYQEKYVYQLVNAVVEAVKEAEKAAEAAQVGYGRYAAPELVFNRLVGEKGKTDPWIRLLKIETNSGKQAAMVTFSAHAVCLDYEEHSLSGDYPGKLVKLLEEEGSMDFAVFCAGAVGSHGPKADGAENFDKMDSLATGLFRHISKGHQNIAMHDSADLHTFYMPVELREPHLKIGKNTRLRPWVFNWMFGDYDPGFKVAKIGNTILVGTPCDFSGELALPIEAYYKEKGYDLIITSFNGGYIGYITPDEYYGLEKMETFEMNWFGPENGAYFSEILMRLADKLE
ncbi:neutral/alkaline non-lysosomal ceramidase N-terminal domain-containing protein [Cytophagaceae bacterium ABcell3]|nr:neutral/alkaline non-lysosomal ceramidase N-terminal domain-containing protein [Cytophagaceae bacterium ABcell3]